MPSLQVVVIQKVVRKGKLVHVVLVKLAALLDDARFECVQIPRCENDDDSRPKWILVVDCPLTWKDQTGNYRTCQSTDDIHLDLSRLCERKDFSSRCQRPSRGCFFVILGIFVVCRRLCNDGVSPRFFFRGWSQFRRRHSQKVKEVDKQSREKRSL